MASLKYWLWLASLPKLSLHMKLALLEHFGEPDRIYYGEQGEYLLVKGMTRPMAACLEDKSLQTADQILGDCDRLGLRILTIRDTEYPERLQNIDAPPLLLYVQGRMPRFEDEVAIAMVGTRKASPYAITQGEKLAFQMAGLGAVIVSGLAAGGDAAAHRGALRAGGLTARSGALITADRALDQGRDLFILPGQVDDWHCAGSNRLLGECGYPVQDAWDVLSHYAAKFPNKIRPLRAKEPQHFGSGRPSARREAPAAPPPPPALPVLDLAGDHGLTDDQLRIVRALRGGTLQVDELIELTQLPARRVLSALTVLEIDRVVTQESGKRFSLAVTLTPSPQAAL